MLGRARIHQKSICYHVINRGVNRNLIFSEKLDRKVFMGLVEKYKALHDVRVYYWVLMGNHFHLLIEVAFENLWLFVGGIRQSYAQYHHKTHQTCGTFWLPGLMTRSYETGNTAKLSAVRNSRTVSRPRAATCV